MYSCGGKTTPRPLAVAACSLLLAIVVILSAEQPAAAEVTGCAAKSNKDCVLHCTEYISSIGCKLACEVEITRASCEACKAKTSQVCSAKCYTKCQELQGCCGDVATMCSDCQNTCLQQSFGVADGMCSDECRPEMCWRCSAAWTAESVWCGDACAASTADRTDSCVEELACGSGSGGGSSKPKCVRCPAGKPEVCEGCKKREQLKSYKDCLTQASGCPSSLIKWP